jgi:hypothetical protein
MTAAQSTTSELTRNTARHAVLDGAWEMEVHLLGLAGRNQRRAGDQAAVALRELRPLPDVPEQHVVGELAARSGAASLEANPTPSQGRQWIGLSTVYNLIH